jgi:hypothetical protein
MIDYGYLDNPWQFLKKDAWLKYLLFIEIMGIILMVKIL